jgi:recombination protein RecA
VLEAGLEHKIVQKSGSYFSFDDERLGQGRQNAAAFLREHPDASDKIVLGIQAALGEDAIASARLQPDVSAEHTEQIGKKAKEAEAALEEAVAAPGKKAKEAEAVREEVAATG